MSKTIFITGGSSGVGLATAEKCLSKGHQVIIVSHTRTRLNNAYKVLEKKYTCRVKAYLVNISKSDEVKEVINKVIDEYSKIDILINSVGVNIHAKFSDLSEHDFDEIFNINVKGTFLICKEVWKYMEEKKSGLIINISSGSGLKGYQTGSIYCSSKAAVNMFMDVLSQEGQDRGIKVANICPGQINTPMWNENDKIVNNLRDKMIQPLDIAEYIDFIIDKSPNINFANVNIFPTNINSDEQLLLRSRNRSSKGKFPQ